MTHRTPEPDIQARTVAGFCAAYGVCRATAYNLLRAGRLVAVKYGTRTLIDEASARIWYEGLKVQPHKSPHKSALDCGSRQ